MICASADKGRLECQAFCFSILEFSHYSLTSGIDGTSPDALKCFHTRESWHKQWVYQTTEGLAKLVLQEKIKTKGHVNQTCAYFAHYFPQNTCILITDQWNMQHGGSLNWTTRLAIEAFFKISLCVCLPLKK